MSLNKIDIGKMIQEQIEKGYTADKIGQWAYNILQKYSDNITQEVENILYRLQFIEEGPEFELSHNELKLLVKFLIQDENDPLGLVQKINPKFKWGAEVHISKFAPERFRPDSLGLVRGMFLIKSEQMAKKFDLHFDPNVDTQIYLVELKTGENIEIPKCYLTILG